MGRENTDLLQYIAQMGEFGDVDPDEVDSLVEQAKYSPRARLEDVKTVYGHRGDIDILFTDTPLYF